MALLQSTLTNPTWALPRLLQFATELCLACYDVFLSNATEHASTRLDILFICWLCLRTSCVGKIMRSILNQCIALSFNQSVSFSINQATVKRWLTMILVKHVCTTKIAWQRSQHEDSSANDNELYIHGWKHGLVYQPANQQPNHRLKNLSINRIDE